MCQVFTSGLMNGKDQKPPFLILADIQTEPRCARREELERVRRVELPTLCLASIRSSQLSYTRMGKIFTSIIRACQFSNFRSVRGSRLPKAKKIDVIIDS